MQATTQHRIFEGQNTQYQTKFSCPKSFLGRTPYSALQKTSQVQPEVSCRDVSTNFRLAPCLHYGHRYRSSARSCRSTPPAIWPGLSTLPAIRNIVRAHPFRTAFPSLPHAHVVGIKCVVIVDQRDTLDARHLKNNTRAVRNLFLSPNRHHREVCFFPCCKVLGRFVLVSYDKRLVNIACLNDYVCLQVLAHCPFI